MKKRIVAIMTMCALLLTTAAIPAMSEEGASSANQQITKDETVYATLGYDGSVKSISVVNHIDTPADGVYTDVGTYDSIANLTGQEAPKVADSRIVWTLPARPEGFYYQGNLAAANLPFKFTISYTLDGNELKAEELAGKQGKVNISVKVEPNGAAPAYFKENFICQIQLPLSLSNCSNISAPGTSTVLTGKTLTLAYMVLPGKNGDFTASFDTTGFESDGMTITCSKFDMSGFLDMGTLELESGITKLTGGMGELVKGTEMLKDGLTQLGGGVTALAEASEQLVTGTEEVKNGVISYAAAGKSLSDKAKAIGDGLTTLIANGGELSAKYDELAAGASKLIDAMLATMSPLEKAAFEQQAGQLKAGLTSYGEGFKTYTSGVKETGQGMTQFTAGLKAFAENGSDIAAGAIGIETGAQKLNSGVNAIAGIATVLPIQTQKLADGQKQLLGGISDAAAELSGLLSNGSTSVKAVSFVSPGVSPRSVQFVIKTPSIKAETAKVPATEQKPQKKGFLQKFLDLFR